MTGSRLSPAAIAVLLAVEQAGADGMTTRELVPVQERLGDGRSRAAMLSTPANLFVGGYLRRLGPRHSARWMRTAKPIPAAPAPVPVAPPPPAPPPAPANPSVYIGHAGRQVLIPAHASSVFDMAAGVAGAEGVAP